MKRYTKAEVARSFAAIGWVRSIDVKRLEKQRDMLKEALVIAVADGSRGYQEWIEVAKDALKECEDELKECE